jgi:hypothetical protein
MRKFTLSLLFAALFFELFAAIPTPENKCLNFDGINDYVALSNESAYDFSGYFTIEFWIKVNAWERPWQAIITKGDNTWRIHRNGTANTISFQTGDKVATTTTEFNDGEWHHVVCEKYAGLMKIYVDDVSEGSALNCPWDFGVNDYPVMIGENAQTTGRYFNGQIDDIRIWSNGRYHTSGTLPSDFWHTPPDLTSGALVSYFSMDDDTNSSILVDDKGTGNGTIYGAQYGTSPTPVGPNWYGGNYFDPLTFEYDLIKVFDDIRTYSSLTIEPGVTIEFQGYFGITIDPAETFQADGTEAEPITFTVADTTGFSEIDDETDTTGGWKNLSLSSGYDYNEIRTIDYCIFEYAKSSAIYVKDYTEINITNSLFRNNYSLGKAGAIYVKDNNMHQYESLTTIENCTFENNRSYGFSSDAAEGGAIYIYRNDAVIRNCIFDGNISSGSGGAFALNNEDFLSYSFSTEFYNNILINNSAQNGGALSILNYDHNTFNNNIFKDNAAENGGGIYFDGSANLSIYNSIIMGNTADSGNQIYINSTNSAPSFEYNFIEGGFDEIEGAGVVSYSGAYAMCWDRDPLFIGSGEHPYDISDLSPCINSGKPGTTAGDYDFAGNPRIYGDGLITCGNNDLDVILNSIDIGVYEKQQDSGVIPYDYTWTNNYYSSLWHDIIIPVGTTFTIVRTTSIGFDVNTSMTIYGSLIINPLSNYFDVSRLNSTHEKPMISFIGPSTEENFSSIEMCRFWDNGAASVASEKGGIIYVKDYDNLRISNSKFIAGKADYGGGVYIENASPEIYNCLFNENHSMVSGGAVYCENADPILANLTMLENTSDGAYSAIDGDNDSNPKIYSCVIWNNDSAPVKAGLDVYFSNVEGGYSGSTNIDADPQLSGFSGNHSFDIYSTSPCLNAGMADVSELNMPETDLNGNPRIHAHSSSAYDRIDMGAVEYAGLMSPTNLNASDGDNNYPGYVHLTWDYVNTYQPISGFHIYRDDNLISTVYPQGYSFDDYEAIPGVPYTYRVSAYAGSELSVSSSDDGFLKPNGIITGTITTPNNNPVANIPVSLSPSSGFCLEADDGSFVAYLTTSPSNVTFEFWAKTVMSDFDFFSFIEIISEEDWIEHAILKVDVDGKLVYTDNTTTILQEADSLVVNDNEWHHIAVTTDMDNTATKMYIDGILVANSSNVLDISSSDFWCTGSWEVSYTGFLDDIRLWSIVRTQEEIATAKDVVVSWNSDGLDGYWAMNEGNGDIAFDATNNGNNILLDEYSYLSWSNDEPGIALGGITNNWGEYSITQIPYGNFTTFTVTPHKEGHFFQPEQRLITLSESSISANNVDFTDDSLIPISGRVMFQNTLEPVREAAILLNGQVTIPPTFTDDEGYYVMEVEHGTDCLLSVSYHEQEFNRVWDLGVVTFPQANKNFEDVSRINLVVEVNGGDEHYPIGAFDVTLQSMSGLYESTFDASGGEWYTAGRMIINNVPPLNYHVTVEPNATVEPGDPFNLLVNQDFIDLSTADTDLRYPEEFNTIVDTVAFVWINELQIEVDWPMALEMQYFNTDLDSLFGFYVLPQNEWCEVDIKAFEDYSFEPFNRKTYLTEFDITITDEVGTQGETEISIVDTTNYTYQFAPYLPNLIAGGDRPYQNMLEITVYDNELNRYATQTDWLITEGVRPRETTFATTSPEIPFLILHDPPGDRSFSSFKQSSSHSMAFGTSVCTNRESNDFVTIHLGADFTTVSGFLFSIENEIDMTFDINMGWTQSVSQKTSTEQKFTFTTSEEYRTSSDDQMIGDGSDLFVGGALNLIWGITDEIDWDEIEQEVIQDTSLMVSPNGFDTIYMYTDRQIRETVIPNLEALHDSVSVALWQGYLDINEDNKDNAVANPNHPSNLSFNSGAGYSFEEESTIESALEIEFESSFSSEFGMVIGGTFDGIGAEGGFSYKTKVTMGRSMEAEESTTTKTSFTLADDDETTALNFLADYFTLDVKKDPVYGTPVFDLISGASSCPWEQNTVPREGVSLSANTYTASGLLEGEQAAFILQLGNTSQTEEDRRYYLTVMHGTNPGGALVKINGVPLESVMAFDVMYGEAVQAIMTVEQGPFDYEYEDLTIEFYTEGDRGHPAPTGHSFDEFKSFNIYWEPPYSRVNIYRPTDNWILNAASGDTLEVIINEYDLSKPDFESIKFQYKRPYQENWFTAAQIYRAELEALPNEYVTVNWDVSQLSDGIYQIRAGTTDSLQSDYYCDAVLGTIDRKIPEILGYPQPADGILSLGDEISISFTEFIDPTFINPFTTSLVINRTGTEIDINIECFENTIVLTPLWENYWLENETLTANVAGIIDLFGNSITEEISWEFFVNANPVFWEVTKIEMIKPLGEPLTIQTQLINSGGQFSSFSLSNMPYWLTANINSGTLLPLDAQDITFTVSEQLGYGTFQDTVFADVTTLGQEPLIFEISVLANPPLWSTTQLQYLEHSMSITGELYVENELSNDSNDVIGAFVYDENEGYLCRGYANLQKVPYFEDTYQFFLTIYSDTEYGDDLIFRIWDSSANKEHYGIEEEFIFASGSIYGTPLSPQSIHATSELFSSMNCRNGWNWISFNLENQESMTVENLLGSLQPSHNDIIKNQTAYAQYIEGIGWVGDLAEINTKESIKLKLSQADELWQIGLLEDMSIAPINYGSGWNWIGYLPHVSLSVNQALANISNAVTGDLIKSQNGYSQYLEGYGWFGSMLFMNPGSGFMLNTDNSGSFTYPEYNFAKNEEEDFYAKNVSRLQKDSGWTVNPLAYEFSSNVTSIVYLDDELLNTENALLGAFYGSECRGIAAPIYVLDKWMFFLTQYANVYNETLTYKLYLENSDEIIDLEETLPFINNQIMGNPLEPFEFHTEPLAMSAPQNLTVEFIGNEAHLSWDSVAGAESYKIYASESLDGIFTEITGEGLFLRNEMKAHSSKNQAKERISWSIDATTKQKEFYKVTAFKAAKHFSTRN